MTKNWLDVLPNDPLPALLEWADKALTFFARQDLMEEPLPTVERLWELPDAIRLVKKQLADGSWKYAGKSSGSIPGQNYALLETFRNLRVLVEMYGFTRDHPGLQKAAAYLSVARLQRGISVASSATSTCPTITGLFWNC